MAAFPTDQHPEPEQAPWLVRITVTWANLPNLEENKLADNPPS